MTKNKQAKKYERQKLLLSLTETVLGVFLLMVIIFGSFSVGIRNWAAAYAENPYLQLLLFSAALGLIFTALSLPFSFVSGFWLEHRYQLSNQTLPAWIWEKLKGTLVGIVLVLPVLLIFYYFLLNFPNTWWLWTATVLFIFSVLIGRIAPTLIFPLFYKFERLDDEVLKKRMENLARQGKFQLEGLYRFNMSKTTRKANAAFAGLGKSRRIILGDTLIEKFTPDEIEAVFAHEVGHYVHKHLWKGVAVGTLSSYASLFIAFMLYNYLVAHMNFTGPADLAALPLLSLILTVMGLVISPLNNIQSRHHERQADRYALTQSSNPVAFLIALKKLADTNLTDESPHPLIEYLFHSHPSISRRMQFAERLGVTLPEEQAVGG